MKLVKAPGVTAYVMIALWFLLTILTPIRAGATELVALSVSDIAPEIEAALMEKGMDGAAEISFADPQAHFLTVPGAATTFENVSYNPASGRFLIRMRGADNAVVSIAGMAREPARLPVLVGPVERGERISADNIAWIETTGFRAADYVATERELVGMEARRPLALGEPVRRIDVTAPVLVKRGAAVAIVYEADGLTLTHAGIARETGALGDVVSVENTRSERAIKAVVTAANTVSVSPMRTAFLEH